MPPARDARSDHVEAHELPPLADETSLVEMEGEAAPLLLEPSRSPPALERFGGACEPAKLRVLERSRAASVHEQLVLKKGSEPASACSNQVHLYGR